MTALNPDTEEISEDKINSSDKRIDFEVFWKSHEIKKKKPT